MATKFLSKIASDSVGGIDGALRFVLGNGLEVQARLDDMSEDMKTALAWHGLSQKVGDAAAGFSKAGDYSGAFSVMQQVVDNLLVGVWATRGSGGGLSDLVSALCTLRGLDVAVAQSAVDAMDEDELKRVSTHPQIKAAIAKLKADRLAKAAENATELDLDLN